MSSNHNNNIALINNIKGRYSAWRNGHYTQPGVASRSIHWIPSQRHNHIHINIQTTHIPSLIYHLYIPLHGPPIQVTLIYTSKQLKASQSYDESDFVFPYLLYGYPFPTCLLSCILLPHITYHELSNTDYHCFPLLLIQFSFLTRTNLHILYNYLALVRNMIHISTALEPRC